MIQATIITEPLLFKDPTTGETTKISNSYIKKVEIFQSITTTTPEIHIFLNDLGDVREEFDLRGGVLATLVVEDYYSHKIDVEMVLNEIVEVVSDAMGNTIHKLTFYLNDTLDFLHTRLYKSYNKTSPDKLVKGWIPSVKTAATTEIEKFNCAGDTINRCVRRLTKITGSSTGNGFMFFSTIFDTYFMNIKTLLKLDDVVDAYNVAFNPDDEFNLIDFHEKNHYKTLNILHKNIFKSKTSYFDFEEGKVIETETEVSGESVSDGDELYHPVLEERAKINHQIGASSTIVDEATSRVVLDRYSKRYQCLLNGSFKIVPGKVIEVVIPSKHTPGNFSKEHNGKYLIIKTAHHLEAGKMMVKCELVKDNRN